MNSKAIIEGLIFLSGEEGLTIHQISESTQIEDYKDIRDFIEQIKKEYESDETGFEIVEYASRFKFITKEFVYPYAQYLFESEKTVSLSQAALETLAIVAYKQPITRVEIEEIRGVNCDVMLKKLQARGLIEAKDRLDTIGKPLLYTVTDVFLDTFQLETLEELPKLSKEESFDKELFEEVQ